MNGPYRILYLKQEIVRNAGDSHYLLAQARALSARGHEQVILTARNELEAEFDAIGVRTRIGPMDNRRKNPLHAWRSVRAILDVARSEKADLLHAHHRWSGFLGWIASRLLGIPVVSTDHAELRSNRLLSFRGEAVIAVSEKSREHLVRHFGVPAEKIAVIGGFTTFKPTGAAGGWASYPGAVETDTGAFVIGHVAQFVPVKGQAILLDAFARVARSHPEALLVMVGDGPLRDELEAHARTLGIESRVRWLGMRRDTSDIYATMDLFVLSSLSEGFGLVVLEAMLAGVPVVATAVGGVPDLLDSGRCGMIVPPGEANALAEAIERMICDPDTGRLMAESGKTRVSALFDPAALAEKVEAVYARVCAARSAPWRREPGSEEYIRGKRTR